MLLNGGGFSEYQACPAYRPATQVNHVPGLRMTVFRGIFAHGGNDDTVLQFDFADLQWSEEFHVFPSGRRCIATRLFDARSGAVVSGKLMGSETKRQATWPASRQNYGFLAKIDLGIMQ